MKYFITSGERTLEVSVVERSGRLVVEVDGNAMDLDYNEVDRLGQVVMTRGGRTFGMSIEGSTPSSTSWKVSPRLSRRSAPR